LGAKSSKEEKEEKELDAAGFGAQREKRKRGFGGKKAGSISFSLIALCAKKTFTIPATLQIIKHFRKKRLLFLFFLL